MTIKPYIHPTTPRRLKTEFRRAKYNFHTLAKARGVNVYRVHRLIRYGEQPTNPNIRKMLFLPKYPRLPEQTGLPTSTQAGLPTSTQAGGEKTESKPLPPHVKWWRYQLTKESRSAIVERLYKHAKEIDLSADTQAGTNKSPSTR